MSPVLSEKTTIQLLPHEYWWGGRTLDAIHMPYHKDFFYQDLSADLGGNQACPLLISSHGRYIWSEQPFSFEFKEGFICINHALGQIELGQNQITLRNAFLTAAKKHFRPSRKTPASKCFLSPQYNTWIAMKKNPSQKKILAFAKSILGQGLPPGVLIIDDWWYSALGEFSFHSEKFPNPKKMIHQLHRMGFLVFIWISPFIAKKTALFQKLNTAGYLIMDKQRKKIAELQWWNGVSAGLDLSNPDCTTWLQQELTLFQKKYHIDGFKFDGGDADLYKNTFSYYAKMPAAVRSELFGRIGLKYKNSEYRACWKLGGTHLIQRIRDKHHRWKNNGLDDLIPGAIALGLMGHSFCCPDMVGGGDIDSFNQKDFKLDPELFVRWVQLSTFFPIIQYSLLPNLCLDKKHLRYCKTMFTVRKKIAPYIYKLAKKSAKTGEPILRPMEYNYPHKSLAQIQDQFMVGEKYLVAPVLEKGATSRLVIFPPGKWQSATGEIILGPQKKEIAAPLSIIPYFKLIKALNRFLFF